MTIALAGSELMAGMISRLRSGWPLFDSQRKQEDAKNNKTGKVWEDFVHQMK
ncbi:MAG: hypothetical protein P8X96_07530 [Desulfobacteraceae bacterium]